MSNHSKEWLFYFILLSAPSVLGIVYLLNLYQSGGYEFASMCIPTTQSEASQLLVLSLAISEFSSVICVFMCSATQLCPTLCNPRDCSPPGSSVTWNSPDKNIGVGCHVFLQGIFPTKESKPGQPLPIFLMGYWFLLLLPISVYVFWVLKLC